MSQAFLADVESRVNYIARSPQKPYVYEYDPPPGVERRTTVYEERSIRIRNARTRPAPPRLDAEGFELRRHATVVRDFYDPGQVEHVYYPEVQALVARTIGASSVIAFDHNVRGKAELAARRYDVKDPVGRVHNDYTAQSAVRRVRDLVPAAEAEHLLAHRVVEVNVWRPIRGPVRRMPLAVLDANSVQPRDLVATDLIYPERRGEIYYIAHNDEHAWYYYPDMQPDEALFIKGYDSDGTRARFGAHVAFAHPATPADAPPRESIEVRTFAFFAP